MISLLTFIDDENDRDIFVRIYNENRSEMYSFAYSILRDSGLSEDAVHDSFLKVARYFSKIDFTRNTRGLLLTIVRNTAFNIKKKHERDFISSNPVDQLAEDPAHIEADFENKDIFEKLLRDIEKMPEEYSTVFRLRYIHDLTYSQIAQLLNISVSAAKKRAQRVREHINKSGYKGEM